MVDVAFLVIEVCGVLLGLAIIDLLLHIGRWMARWIRRRRPRRIVRVYRANKQDAALMRRLNR